MKLQWYGILGIILLAGAGAWYTSWRINKAEHARVVAQLEARIQRQINESTYARLTTSQADKEALKRLLEASEELQGKLVAGLVLHFVQKDTVVQHSALPTTQTDSTRTATFKDSTVAGDIEGIVTAPPCCAPLGISYRLTRPAFDPAVGFVQVGDTIAAVVSYRGEHVEIRSPYMVPRAKKGLQTLHGFGAGYFDPLDRTVEGRAGIELNATNNWWLQAGGSTSTGLFLGIQKSFNLFSTKE